MPYFRTGIRIFLLSGIVALTGVACYRHLPFKRTARSLFGSILGNLPTRHAVSIGGSPTSALSNSLSGGGFKTVAAIGLIADNAKTTASFRVREGWIPVLLTNVSGTFILKPEPDGGVGTLESGSVGGFWTRTRSP